MHFHDTLSALLPPPRDDEPANLRQDIVDELGDHLASAYNRELLRGVGSSVARQRVVERFGDPAAVARRLWFDAMKEKIMAQRVLIATCLVVTLASVSLVGMIWQQSSAAQRNAAGAAAAASQAMSLQNEKAQATQQEMLKQMREMSESIRNTRSLDWNPVTFQLTEDTPDGPPAVGASIALDELVTGSGGAGMGQAASKPGWHITDGTGRADFGVVHPGDYTFRVFRDWDQQYLTAAGKLRIEPGSQVNTRIVCPKAPLERARVRVGTAWPANLEKENLALYASFELMPMQRDGRPWTLCDIVPTGPKNEGRFPMSPLQHWLSHRTVLRGPASSMAQVLPHRTPIYWALNVRPGGILADIRSVDLRDMREPAEAMEWEKGTYELKGVVVLRPTKAAGEIATRRRFEVLFMSQAWGSNTNTGYDVLDKPPTDDDVDGPRTDGAQTKRRRATARAHLSQFNVMGLKESVPWESSFSARGSFEARPGQINEFVIRLSDELFEAVRDQLKSLANAP